MRAIPDNRPAKPAAGLLLFEARLGRRERVTRVEPFIAMEVVDATMQVVGARSRDSVQDDAGRVAILCLVLVRQDLKFLHGIGRRGGPDTVHRHQLGADAVNERLAAAARLAAGTDRLFGRSPALDHAGNEQRERRRLAAGERETVDLLAADRLSKRRRRHLDRRHRFLDGDRLGDAPHFEGEIERDFLSDLEPEALALQRLEAGELGGQVVDADRQVRQHVRAGGIGGRRPHDAGTAIADRHRDARQHRLAGVADDALQGRSDGLAGRGHHRNRGGEHRRDYEGRESKRPGHDPPPAKLGMGA